MDPGDPDDPDSIIADVERPAGSARERVAVRRRKTKDGRRPRRIALGVLGILIVVAAVGAAGALAYLRGVERDTRLIPTGMRLDPKSREPGPPVNIVVLGSDIRNYEIRRGETRSRSDTIMLLRVDPKTKRAWALSFPRDMRVPIPGYGTDKINAAHFYGGAPLVVETIKSLTNMPVHDYVEVDFNGFKQLVDAIGGVWINVDTEIHDIKAANHDQSAKDLSVGYQKLDGKHALTFVRSRNFPTGDFKRIENQQKFMDALLAQTVRIQNVFRLPQLVGVFRRNVKTSMSLEEMTNLAFDMRGVKRQSLQKAMVTGKDTKVNGVYYLMPDYDRLALLSERMTALEPFEGPATGGSIPNEDISIMVRNGSGVTGRGKSLGARLKLLGFDVKDVGTAKQSNYVSTLIVYKAAHQAEAQQVQKALGLGRLQPATAQHSFSTDVLVVVGKDYKPKTPDAATAQGAPRTAGL